jgi:hypothetical protein
MIFGIDPRRYANTGVPQGNASIKTVPPVIGAEHRCRVSEKNHIHLCGCGCRVAARQEIGSFSKQVQTSEPEASGSSTTIQQRRTL